MDASLSTATATLQSYGSVLAASDGYTETEKAHALAIYAESGSIASVERITSIPYSTIKRWLDNDESVDLVARLRSALRERAAWNYAEIIELAQRQLKDRLMYGDPHVTARGGIVYHPVKARDLSLIASVAQDKHAMLTGGLETSKAAGQMLAALAAELLKHKPKPKPKVKDDKGPPPVDASSIMG